MNQVIDSAGRSWPATVQSVNQATVIVQMAGPNGLAAIATPGNGSVVDGQGIQYNVTLPPAASAGLQVTLTRR